MKKTLFALLVAGMFVAAAQAEHLKDGWWYSHSKAALELVTKNCRRHPDAEGDALLRKFNVLGIISDEITGRPEIIVMRREGGVVGFCFPGHTTVLWTYQEAIDP
jgi:hypothetical protein